MIEISGPGVMWAAPIPRCPVHEAPMRLDFAMDRWTCAGYDGEGCAHVVNSEEHLGEFKPIGVVDPGDVARLFGELPSRCE